MATSFDWSPGIGDPTIVGWLTVLLYLVASFLCGRATRRLSAGRAPSSREINIWRCLFVVLLALGINKQLDLQSALTEAGRILAHSHGWYDRRGGVQLILVVLVSLLCLGSIIAFISYAWQTHSATQLALLGTILVLCFVALRTASFHYIDRITSERFLGVRWNWILETTGLIVIIAASLLRHPPSLRVPH